MIIMEQLIKALCSTAVYNPDVQVPPVCILWTDRERQWEAAIPRIQNALEELFILGDYDPEKRTGPAIWLRCIIANRIPEFELPHEKTPILYLPGVSRQDLRAISTCPDHLKPLAELQYRGIIWSQLNAKDWTILAFLKSDQGGLGLDVAQDQAARNAMQLALYKFLDEELSLLKNKRLDRDYFNTLLSGGDPIRDLLQWFDQEDQFRSSRDDNEWKAFVEVCESQLAFNPQKDGILNGAAKLARHSGPWSAVWERFCEAPERYQNIPGQIRKSKMPELELFSNEERLDGWPQWNEECENSLRGELLKLTDLPFHEAGREILKIVKSHYNRKSMVWAELGFSPLAVAGEHLATLAEITANNLSTGTTSEMAQGYSIWGWKADDAVLKALACVERAEDFDAVSAAIRSIYLPWMEESASHLQDVVSVEGYPGKLSGKQSNAPVSPSAGECILFIDGLRFDAAQRLSGLLTLSGMQVDVTLVWSALPSITATGKPAVTPVCNLIKGKVATNDFEPVVAETQKSLKGGYHLKKLLTDNGWTILDKNETGDPSGSAWCEFGDIDHEGHDRGWKIARHLDYILKEIKERILSLMVAGWKKIRVVTDHGWLLMPGGLPRVDLPGVLAENRWGRCASIKPGAYSDESFYPWYWNPDQDVALARGISCYKKGREYAHGGLSLQECLTPSLVIRNSNLLMR